MAKCIHLFWLFFLLLHTTITAQIPTTAINNFLADSAIKTGHVGISFYEPATGKYLYNYNADKNFMPSSNVKIFTLYAALKYLGDSVLAANIYQQNDTTFIEPTGDPTFLHPDFATQPLLKYLQAPKNIVLVTNTKDSIAKYGEGWAWDDALEDFMPERNRLPTYGNVVTFYKQGNELKAIPSIALQPPYCTILPTGKKYKIVRAASNNNFSFVKVDDEFTKQQLPFKIQHNDSINQSSYTFLAQQLGLKNNSFTTVVNNNFKGAAFFSRPIDSLLQPMMYYSDNFFAEQTLLMVSNKRLGLMNSKAIIDTLLQTDFKSLPTKARWVDGSGLSRYNLFSAMDMVFVLNKLQNEFGLQRLKNILPTSGQGTLTNYYASATNNIFAKTGSMSNNVALSGYLITNKKKLLIFSIMVNNYTGSGRAGRKAIEAFVQKVRYAN